MDEQTHLDGFRVGDRVRLSPLAKVDLRDTGAWVQDASGIGLVIESPTKHCYVEVQWKYGTAAYRPEHLERVK